MLRQLDALLGSLERVYRVVPTGGGWPTLAPAGAPDRAAVSRLAAAVLQKLDALVACGFTPDLPYSAATREHYRLVELLVESTRHYLFTWTEGGDLTRGQLLILADFLSVLATAQALPYTSHGARRWSAALALAARSRAQSHDPLLAARALETGSLAHDLRTDPRAFWRRLGAQLQGGVPLHLLLADVLTAGSRTGGPLPRELRVHQKAARQLLLTAANTL